MKRLFHPVLGLLAVILFAAGCQPATLSSPTPDATATPGVSLVLGDISDEPAETIKGTQPMADYLAARLGSHGVGRGEVKIAPDLETMIQWMEMGEVDLYFDSPYPALVISQAAGAQPILRRQKYGVSEYYSVFFSRADADFAELEDVQGNMVAFEEAFSTSGYMLPFSHLIEQGYRPIEKPSPETAVSPDEVGYVFSTADNTTVQWVVSGKVPIGVVDNVTFRRLPQETQNELRIFAQTGSVPRQLVLVRADLDPELVSEIKAILQAMDESEEGQAVLETFLTSEFDEFPQGASQALGRMKVLYQLVQDQE